MDLSAFICKRPFAGQSRHSKKRRKIDHDYQAPWCYMITMVIEGRKSLLGDLEYKASTLLQDNPACRVKFSDLGKAVKKEIDNIKDYYPQIKTYKVRIMPDHVHFIIHVTERIPVHLSVVISGLKLGINKIWGKMNGDCPSLPPLWEDGFCDKILFGEGMLNRWFVYLDLNPLRLALKKTYPHLFKAIFDLPFNVGADFPGAAVGSDILHLSTLGNRFLLDAPWKVEVQLSRRLTDSEIEEKVNFYLNLADEGAVLVSPSISKGEKAVMRAAFDNGFPIILIASYGFDSFSKVGHIYHNACTAGRFLMISYKDQGSRPRFGRQLCLELNEFTRRLCQSSRK